MRRWNEAEAGKSDIEQLVFLSNLIGSDPSLVQPGGGNTSVKLKEPDLFGCETHSLVVKGSGTDLRTVGPAGFTHLYLDRLSLLRQKDSLSDEEMMALMRACILFPDRDHVPSVETPLHALLSARFVAHTHDVATLSLTDAPHAEENARRVFGQEIAFLEYVRPGFPLAKRLAERYAEGPPAGAIALVMEKHGLAVWGDTAGDCYETLRVVIEKAEAFVAEQAAGKRAYDSPSATSLDAEARRDIASALLPAIRGELARGGWRCVLHLDDSPDTVEAIAAEEFPDIGARGVMTPEHILRAGVRPLIVLLEDDRGVGAEQHADRHPIDDGLAGVAQPLQHHADHIRHAISTHRGEYAAYADRHGQEPIPDFLKTIIVPGVGVVYAGKDRRAALVAALRQTILHFGGIDVLFYSPGVGPEYHSVVDMPDEEIEQKLAVHYRGAVAATREAARVMIEQGTGGRLIYNASKAAFAPGEGFAAYGASKAALVHYVRNVANELGRDGITANYINADAVDTPMFREVLRLRAERAGVSEKEMLDRYAERSPLREAIIPPEAVAEAALWLASDRAEHTTGCVITVGGGAEGFPR